ncbi:hypothetical protein IAQ61_011120 [Plenodomus lingam]|uniref:uncharacterized protein n=1 Tax=Leptosphaeria maculans TaxID=5022 RepID=UPI003321AFB0|nr:hypothetical protein IAQ61_011120 [Plenodomus lingam]
MYPHPSENTPGSPSRLMAVAWGYRIVYGGWTRKSRHESLSFSLCSPAVHQEVGQRTISLAGGTRLLELAVHGYVTTNTRLPTWAGQKTQRQGADGSNPVRSISLLTALWPHHPPL